MIESNLFTIGFSKGNLFIRTNLNQNITITSSITTIIINDGILMFNYANETYSSGLTATGTKIKTLVTYKLDKYANYIDVEIHVDYRILTISY